jgi:hypothetical protein
MMTGEIIEESDRQTIRGLEYRTRKGAVRRQHNKVEAITAVMDEQDRQIEEGFMNDELISQVYMEVSARCQEEAHQLALKDVQFVETYKKEDTPNSVPVTRKAPGKTNSFGKLLRQMSLRRKPVEASPSKRAVNANPAAA